MTSGSAASSGTRTRTSKVCVPCGRPTYVFGSGQGPKLPFVLVVPPCPFGTWLESRHSYWSSRPSALKSNVAVVLSVGLAGSGGTSVTGGARPPTSHANSTGVSSTWPPKTARTPNSCEPKTRFSIVTPAGLLVVVPSASHGTYCSSLTPSSIAHWKVAPGLFGERNVKVAEASLVTSGGADRSSVSGSESTVHV